MFLIIIVLIKLLHANGSILNNSESSACNVLNPLYSSEGHIKIAIILNECSNSNFNPTSTTYINSATWIVERLNVLNFTAPFRLGLSIFQACAENDYYNPIYKIFKQDDNGFLLGALSNNPFPPKIRKFGEVLGVHLDVTETHRTPSVQAAVKLLADLDLAENLTVYSERHDVLQEFFKFTREESMCVKNAVILDDRRRMQHAKRENGPVVVFGGHENIRCLLGNFSFDETVEEQMIFVPFDGSEINDFPEGSYIIQPIYSDNNFLSKNSTQFVPSPLLFDVANSILNFAINISNFINENCNETLYKLNCLRHKFPQFFDHPRLKFTDSQILSLLKIEPLADTFVYKIFRVENLTAQNYSFDSPKSDILQSFVNVFTYSIFNKTLINLESDIDGVNDNDNDNNSVIALPKTSCSECVFKCINFEAKNSTKTILVSYVFARFGLRSESWVFAFLSVSILGVLFCIAILIFLIVRFCKRDILEGNPFLTILLLLSVMLMYSSVIPYTLESDKGLKSSICLARSLSTTLTYAFAFSLLLSRSILLATVSKEVGFMSHVPGTVQSFLTLFIFAVQGALSLQFLNHCEDIFRGISFVYLMSYNIILLILLVFICPLNTRAQRNYREGKHFMVAVVLLACTWSCWIPGYAVLEEEWKDPILCLGLVATASILLGAVFIPRTYMMTIAATRDRLSNILPSLPATSSLMDVYRASTQPVYDCINVAAINAATIARSSIPPPPPPQPEIYSSLAVPYDDEFDFQRCITPNQDKVTRF